MLHYYEIRRPKASMDDKPLYCGFGDLGDVKTGLGDRGPHYELVRKILERELGESVYYISIDEFDILDMPIPLDKKDDTQFDTQLSKLVMRRRERYLLDYPPSIRDLRGELDMSRKEFCERFLIEENTLKSWENGKRHPPKALNIALAKLSDRINIERYASGSMELYYRYPDKPLILPSTKQSS